MHRILDQNTTKRRDHATLGEVLGSYKSKIRDHASGAKVLGSNKSKRRDHASGAAVFEIIILKVAAGRLGGRSNSPGTSSWNFDSKTTRRRKSLRLKVMRLCYGL